MPPVLGTSQEERHKTMLQDTEVVPQPLGEYQPVDQWQAHVNDLFHQLRGERATEYFQTFTSSDYRLAHALAADYVERVRSRDRKWTDERRSAPLVVHEWGASHGNLAACFLSHVKSLDQSGTIYPRIRYVLVDLRPQALARALAHPDLAGHLDRVETICGNVEDLSAVEAGTVDRIFCNELWNELPTKLMTKKEGEVEEEHVRPNLSEAKHVAIADWSGFLRAFTKKDVAALAGFPPFFDDVIWEREYRKVEWKDVPYRKTIMEFLKQIDDQVLVPVNVGTFGTVKEAKRLLMADGIGFSSFDAGTADLAVLNNPEKPCSGQFGGLYSVMVNLALVTGVANHLGIREVLVEPQREFVGRSLGVNVITLTDLLATHPKAKDLAKWEQDRLIVQTIRALNESYHSPYRRTLHFPLSPDFPQEEREAVQGTLLSMKQDGVPDTVAYLTEEEILASLRELEALGYERDEVDIVWGIPPAGVDYAHWSFKR